jgi:hypothetical protein
MKSIPALLIIILFAYNFLNVFSYEDWLSFGGTGENNINNNRNSDAEKIISPKNVGSLKVINIFSLYYNFKISMSLNYKNQNLCTQIG